MKEIGQRIAHIRRSRGESQQQIAKATGIALRTWAALERGENVPSGDTLLRIADLGWNPGWVLVGLGEEKLSSYTAAGAIRAGDPLVPAPQSSFNGPDIDALVQVVQLVEDWLTTHGRVMEPAKKAETIGAIYQFVMEDVDAGAKSIDTRKLTQFLRLVA